MRLNGAKMRQNEAPGFCPITTLVIKQKAGGQNGGQIDQNGVCPMKATTAQHICAAPASKPAKVASKPVSQHS